MKKLVALLISLQLMCLHAAAIGQPIEDDFAQQTLEKFKDQKPQLYIKTIEDGMIDENFIKNAKSLSHQAPPIVDTFAQNTLVASKLKAPIVNLDYDYSYANMTPIEIKAIRKISTKEKMEEGKYIRFQTTQDVVLPNGVKLAKNTEIAGRIETLSLNKPLGVPADLTIGNFMVRNNPQIQFTGAIDVTGANRSLWLYPAMSFGMMFFFAGALLAPIRGGHAVVRPDKIYTVHYRQQ